LHSRNGPLVFQALKSMEPGLPKKSWRAGGNWSPKLASRQIGLHQGVRCFPAIPLPLALLLLAVLGRLCWRRSGQCAPLFAKLVCRKKFPEGRTSSRLADSVGLPVFVIWFTLASLALADWGGWGLGAGLRGADALALKFGARPASWRGGL